MPGRRVERLNEQLRREVVEILRGSVRDPRVGAVTVTGARVAPDLSIARIFVSPHGDETESLAGLAAATPYIRGELGRRLHIRRAPELRFEVDRSLERARRIEALLSEARAAEAAADESVAGTPERSAEDSEEASAEAAADDPLGGSAGGETAGGRSEGRR